MSPNRMRAVLQSRHAHVSLDSMLEDKSTACFIGLYLDLILFNSNNKICSALFVFIDPCFNKSFLTYIQTNPLVTSKLCSFTMLHKLFSSRSHTVDPSFTEAVVEKPLMVKIIHAGGFVERYYMALPAALIIDKYPKFMLTRPEIFQQPWDSVVKPDEMLVPGHKYFVVPILTVKKLRRRMMKTATEMSDSLVSHNKDNNPKPKQAKSNRRVRFKGVEVKSRHDAAGVTEDKMKKNKKKGSSGRGLRRKNVSFSPTLTIIDGRS